MTHQLLSVTRIIGGASQAIHYVQSSFVRIRERVLRLPTPLFLTVIIAGMAAAGFILARGMNGFASLRDAIAERNGNAVASSPWAYGSRVMFEIGGDSTSDSLPTRSLRVVLRVDSLQAADGDLAPCALLDRTYKSVSAYKAVALWYVALSDSVARCAKNLPVKRVASIAVKDTFVERASRPGKPGVKWAILDHEHRVIYSESEQPSPKRVIRILNVLMGPRFAIR